LLVASGVTHLICPGRSWTGGRPVSAVLYFPLGFFPFHEVVRVLDGL